LIEVTEAEAEELRLQLGDVLFNEGGDRDKLGRGWVWSGEIAECIHQNHVFEQDPIYQSCSPNTFPSTAIPMGKVFSGRR
jgi:type I restriction enzyme S subunit